MHQNFITTHRVTPPAIAQVPEPYALGLIGVALIAGWFARRRNAVAQA